MAINNVNTTIEEKNFKFQENQSSILSTVDSGKITVNGVNVIVDKPKVGDIMCVTRYKNADSALLDAEEQEVLWVDGLSIVPKQLSTEFEPVGICVAVNGRKAIVRYKEEFNGIRWSESERWELAYSSIMNDNTEHTLQITLNNKLNPNPFTFKASSRLEFVNQLNNWFKNTAKDNNYSAELVELDTDKPANDTSDEKDGSSYRNRIIVNAKFTSGWNTVGINGITIKRAIGKHVKAVNWYYINNGFTRNWEGGCCRAKYYDYIQSAQTGPTGQMTNINVVTGGLWGGKAPASLNNFTNDPNSYCKILRDTFATYDEYFDSHMIKCPCGAGGTITEFPSGKENTYKLAYCTFFDNKTSMYAPLYLAAFRAASIDVKGPKLTKGNWWLPSSAEMAQMMRDITYGTNSWDKVNINNNTDIVNRVIDKMRSVDTKWAYLSASTSRWTSSRYDQLSAYLYYGNFGSLNYDYFYYGYAVSPITLYEF